MTDVARWILEGSVMLIVYLVLTGFCWYTLRIERGAKLPEEMRRMWQAISLLTTAFAALLAYWLRARLQANVYFFPLLWIGGMAVCMGGQSLVIRLYKAHFRVPRKAFAALTPKQESSLRFAGFFMPAIVQVSVAVFMIGSIVGILVCALIPGLRRYWWLAIVLLVIAALLCAAAFMRVEYQVLIQQGGLQVRWRAGVFTERYFSCPWKQIRKVRMGCDEKQVTYQLQSAQGWLYVQAVANDEAVYWYKRLEEATLLAMGQSWQDGYVILRGGGRVRGYVWARAVERAEIAEEG